MMKAVGAFKKIYKDGDTSENNPMIVLKCPWCGAQMGVVKEGKKPDFVTPDSSAQSVVLADLIKKKAALLRQKRNI
jgi:hypothetical protein